MSRDKDAFFEVVKLEKDKFPKRSRLYSLEPVGIGTPYIESLTSYITRLAAEHSLSTGVLISKEILKVIPKPYSVSPRVKANYFYTRAGHLNGIGVVAKDWVQAVESLTLQKNLHFLTLLTWENIFPTRGLTSNTRTWCPCCYEEWRSTGKVLYEPLLWGLEVSYFCPYHHVRLCFTCPHCNYQSPIIKRRMKPGYCSKCNGWLGLQKDDYFSGNSLSLEETEWQSFVMRNLGELLVTATTIDSPPSKKRTAEAMSKYAEQMGGYAAFARWLNFPEGTVRNWCKSKRLPEIESLLKTCYHLGIQLVDFLANSTAIISINKPIVPPRKTFYYVPQPSRERLNSQKVQDTLQAILERNEVPPPTLKQVIRETGFSYKSLLKHAPELCHSIANKYREYQIDCREKNIDQVYSEIRQAIHTIQAMGKVPTEWQVTKLLTKPAYLREEKVLEFLEEEIQKISHSLPENNI